ncbi:hypothetical protein [Leptolyngbya sp. FACHB-671]|uniref:hypothetical protein n=1 Tax=Leptolyngbya sp. FACHB-671 TaxID=2692812 RepID=UPI00321FA8D5
MHATEVALHHVDVEPPAEILVECFGAIDVGNVQHHDFEFHVWTVYVIATHLFSPLNCEFAAHLD